MRACYMEHVDTIQFLCERNPTALKIKNTTGQTCMDLASQSLNPSIANLLEKKCLETSSEELHKLTKIPHNNSNTIFESLATSSSSSLKAKNIEIDKKEFGLIKNDEIGGHKFCKHSCNLDNLMAR